VSTQPSNQPSNGAVTNWACGSLRTSRASVGPISTQATSKTESALLASSNDQGLAACGSERRAKIRLNMSNLIEAVSLCKHLVCPVFPQIALQQYGHNTAILEFTV